MREPLVAHRDRLQEHGPVRHKQSIDGAEVVVVVFEAHRFEHLDAHHLVVAAGKLAVVGPEYVDSFTRLAKARPQVADVPVLLVADRRRRHTAAVAGGGPGGESAPAAADLQDVVGW